MWHSKQVELFGGRQPLYERYLFEQLICLDQPPTLLRSHCRQLLLIGFITQAPKYWTVTRPSTGPTVTTSFPVLPERIPTSNTICKTGNCSPHWCVDQVWIATNRDWMSTGISLYNLLVLCQIGKISTGEILMNHCRGAGQPKDKACIENFYFQFIVKIYRYIAKMKMDENRTFEWVFCQISVNSLVLEFALCRSSSCKHKQANLLFLSKWNTFE